MAIISDSIKKSAIALSLSALITGCGSSSSSSPEPSVDSDSDQIQDNPFVQSTPEQVLDSLGFELKRQSEAPITEENAEAIILDAIKVIDYLVGEYSEYVNDEGGVISIDSSLPTALEQSIDCNQDGAQVVTMNAPSKLTQDGLRVYGDGDSVSLKYQGCDYIGYAIWGTVGIDVSQGVYDLTNALVPNTVVSQTADKFFYTSTDGSRLLRYYDATLQRTIDSLAHSIASEQFAIFDYQPTYDIEIVLSNLDVTVSQYQVNDFWKGDQIITHDLLTIESNQVQMKYHVAVTRSMKRAEVSSDAFEDGAFAIAGEIGSLYVQFRNGYLDWELDLNSDGHFDVSGVIDASQY